jgi:uncharacterized protein (TIGR02147 family)
VLASQKALPKTDLPKGLELPNSIFEYQSFRDYLENIRRLPLTLSKRPLTYGLWAKRLGYKSPRIVGMVFKGRRLPSADMIERLGRVLKLNRSELRYFNLLVKLERGRIRGRDTRGIIEDLEELNPTARDRYQVEEGTFSFIADWYHVVLRQLIESPDFREDPAWISQKLRKKVSEAQIRQALHTLLNLKLVARDEATHRLARHQKSLVTTHDVPSGALKSHHTQMIQRALEAVTEQDVSERELSATALQFDATKLDEAKKAIRQFRDNFDKKFTSPEGSQVYQLNIQFFGHTDPKRKEKQK